MPSSLAIAPSSADPDSEIRAVRIGDGGVGCSARKKAEPGEAALSNSSVPAWKRTVCKCPASHRNAGRAGVSIWNRGGRYVRAEQDSAHFETYLACLLRSVPSLPGRAYRRFRVLPEVFLLWP
eukprot:373762-Rhodomonas_salina.6